MNAKEFQKYLPCKLNQYYFDAKNSTFLTTEEGETFRFVLRPIMEYFVASRMVMYINDCQIESILETAEEIHTEETFGFIKNMTEVDSAIKSDLIEEISQKGLSSDILDYLKSKKIGVEIFTTQLILPDLVHLNLM